MKTFKNQLIWLLLWIWLTFSLWAFAASNWYLWDLFTINSSWEYKLLWDEILDNTIDSSEIEDNTITEEDVIEDFKSPNSDNLDWLNSEQFLRSDENDTMTWTLTIDNLSYWIRSFWTTAWWYFKDSDSWIYSTLWISEYSLYGNWSIRLKWNSSNVYVTDWKKLATEDYVDSKLSSSNIYHESWEKTYWSTIFVPSWFSKSDCSIIVSTSIPMENDWAYKRSRHYSWRYTSVSNWWKVYTGYRSIQDWVLHQVTNWTLYYMLICSK